jgi:hypothetical protein
MRTRRQQLDRIAWRIIARKKASLGAKPGVGRPSNFPEILQWMREENDSFELSFANFLDEFYYFKRASFFRLEPPKEFTAQQRALLAGTAEYLCHRYKLRSPKWTQKPEYILDQEWNPLGMTNRRKAAPEFKRHGILYPARALIRI